MKERGMNRVTERSMNRGKMEREVKRVMTERGVNGEGHEQGMIEGT